MGKNVARRIFLFPVKGYQKLISPMLGDNCIYTPSCSEYFNRAVMKFGIVKGTILGMSRILRCSRLYYGGPDDVPQTFSFRYIRDRRIAFRRHLRSPK
ncbi:MAG: membrane protein insertion efficiency factor YidD [Spirochaetales bacterium]|nr:membrane protein insertion efficiency factor YidD [Spirochaetales bacterium]